MFFFIKYATNELYLGIDKYYSRKNVFKNIV